MYARAKHTQAAGLTFPIKLRCTSEAALLAEPGVEAALARALGRAFARARASLPAAIAVGRGVVLQPPCLAAGSVPGGHAAAILERVKRAIAAAARADALPLLVETAEPLRFSRASQVATPQAAPFEADRFDVGTASYRLPSYQQPTPGTPTNLPVQPAPPPPTLGLREILDRLRHDDSKLLDDLFRSTPFDELLEVMNELAKQAPGKFLELMRKKIAADAARHAGILRRTSTDVVAAGQNGSADDRDLIDVSLTLMQVLQRVPIGKALLQEQTRKSRDVGLLLGLVEAAMQVRGQLLAYLRASQEKTDPAILKAIEDIGAALHRLAGVFLVAAGERRAQELAGELAADLAEHVRWILATIGKLGDIDNILSLYRILYGTASDDLDEVIALRGARSMYLDAVKDNPIPTRARIVQVMTAANAAYDDWQGRAGDEKLRRINKALVTLEEMASHAPMSDNYGGYTAGDNQYNRKRAVTFAMLRDIKQGSASFARPQPRDAAYLSGISALSAKLPLVSVQLQMLQLWHVSLEIGHEIAHHDIGSKFEQRGYVEHDPIMNVYHTVPGWHDRLGDISDEIAADFDQPKYETLNAKFSTWKDRLNAIQKEVQAAAKHDFYMTIGITIVATVVTAGLFAGAEATVAVTLAEAGTFTAITTVGQAALLGKSVDPGDVIGDFVGNALTFGAFKGLNLGAAAMAKVVAPGRALLQLGIIFGTTSIVATGVPLLLNVVEGKALPDEAKISLVVNLIMNAVMTVMGGVKMRDAIRQVDGVDLTVRNDVADELARHAAAASGVFEDMRAFVNSPDLAPEQFEAFKAKSAKILPGFKALLLRLAGAEFSDAALAQLGITRTQIREMAATVDAATTLIAGSRYVPPPRSGVPVAPNTILALVQTGPNTFEYQPTAGHEAPDGTIQRLRGAGYTVTELGGGVLRLAQGGHETLLLPAAEPGATTLPRDLLEQAVGYRSQADMAIIDGALTRIYPGLAKLLQAEFSTDTAVITLRLLAEHRDTITARWPANAVRGLAEMLKLERGATVTAVKNFMEAAPADQLPGILDQYLAIARSANVRPGVDLLVSEDIRPRNSVKLIGAYRAILAAGLELPDTMSRRAVEGLLRWTLDGRDPVAELKDVAKADRLAKLEAASPIRVPYPVRNPYERAFRSHLQPIQPGLDLFADAATPLDLARAVEALGQPKGGKFQDSAALAEFANTIEGYRGLVRKLQVGRNVLSNASGARREIGAVIAALEKGSVVIASGNKVRLKINPALFPLPGGQQVVNANPETGIQLDLASQTVEGKFLIEEVAASELKLPDELRSLLPGSTDPAHPIDFQAIKDRETAKGPIFEASGRKFQQMIKLRSASLFARELLSGFAALTGNKAEIPLPDMEVNVYRADPEAVIVARLLGFRVVVTPRPPRP